MASDGESMLVILREIVHKINIIVQLLQYGRAPLCNVGPSHSVPHLPTMMTPAPPQPMAPPPLPPPTTPHLSTPHPPALTVLRNRHHEPVVNNTSSTQHVPKAPSPITMRTVTSHDDHPLRSNPVNLVEQRTRQAKIAQSTNQISLPLPGFGNGEVLQTRD